MLNSSDQSVQSLCKLVTVIYLIRENSHLKVLESCKCDPAGNSKGWKKRQTKEDQGRQYSRLDWLSVGRIPEEGGDPRKVVRTVSPSSGALGGNIVRCPHGQKS